jgi:hypothetical protein
LETSEVSSDRPEPVPRQPIRERLRPPYPPIGAVRLPLAVPYRPWVRLYARPDGTLEWVVRLWHVDRPVARTVSTETLRAFARRSGLSDFEREIDELLAQARRSR